MKKEKTAAATVKTTIKIVVSAPVCTLRSLADTVFTLAIQFEHCISAKGADDY